MLVHLLGKLGIVRCILATFLLLAATFWHDEVHIALVLDLLDLLHGEAPALLDKLIDHIGHIVDQVL